jgi:thioredoxin reductase (NADPH)
MEERNLIIIGSGPAGLTAAIYAARASLKPLVLAGITWGGQLMNTTEVENFPGFPDGIQGPELMERMMKQAKKFGAEVRYEQANIVDLKGDPKTIKTDENEYHAKSVIIATGAMPRKLGIPGEDKFYGRGVSTCATCDAAFYRDKVVTIVGGGDSAMEEASFLTRFAKKVYLIHRRDEFRASQIMQDRVKANEKIEIIYNTEVKEVLGEETVQKIKLFNNSKNNESELEVDGMFLAIGHIPVTEFLKNQIEVTEDGYAIADNDVETAIDGVFVSGDVHDEVYRQAITAAGMGCMASLRAQRWLEDKGVEVDNSASSYYQ